MIRECTGSDFEIIYEIINDSSRAYCGIIPDDCWHDPYMSREELESEISDGIIFFGLEQKNKLTGIMGMQDKGDVALIRHAYVRTKKRQSGIGTELLHFIENKTEQPILIGTWRDAAWAISFYLKNKYTLLSDNKKDALLKKYWKISARQIETSVVLADPKWVSGEVDYSNRFIENQNPDRP